MKEEEPKEMEIEIGIEWVKKKEQIKKVGKIFIL